MTGVCPKPLRRPRNRSRTPDRLSLSSIPCADSRSRGETSEWFSTDPEWDRALVRDPHPTGDSTRTHGFCSSRVSLDPLPSSAGRVGDPRQGRHAKWKCVRTGTDVFPLPGRHQDALVGAGAPGRDGTGHETYGSGHGVCRGPARRSRLRL